ncbi:MAG: NAD(P)H-hydrate dehydratase [Synergistaceae bacterium]|nr:NAD(P)H-hydrate dehydratase [Synergistaceae bacterium]
MSVTADSNNISSYTKKDIKGFLCDFPDDIHKGDRGGVLIVGGSWNYRGAPMLAALGSLRAGAGLTVLAIPDFMVGEASMFLPEGIFLPLKTMNDCVVAERVRDTISPWLKRVGALVVGPGIGRGDRVREIVSYFWNMCDISIVMDADALYFLSQMWDSLPYRENIVITPHSGEAGMILNSTPTEVNGDRLAAVTRLSERAGTALLKGKNTLVCCNNKIGGIEQGSPALAVPGSGDVLSGCIGALLARGLAPFDAAACGALIHAVAGENLEKSIGVSGVLAREIANVLPTIIRD